MTHRLRHVLAHYYRGLDFHPHDILRPKEGEYPITYSAKDRQVIVLEQSPLVPHEYTVLGEREHFKKPSDRFVKFTINGHQWEKVLLGDPDWQDDEAEVISTRVVPFDPFPRSGYDWFGCLLFLAAIVATTAGFTSSLWYWFGL